ncbi:uncharacterized protein LOC120072646 isoform X2 [Benincasa hispida]|nr:uncharacterized protein LOC120072646 isoform X2 [Benincasa hispida]XP_038880998.1 uncharacterized protein LOC120072646 isoform X2 [Benincasa hispida]XP_038880999.1 uncharacterized protein LOC120072646 isoform X2 [Benincasa hispida]XP_038881000.1 uncharacterized protein LOC120072646 isoform X2 [Benincasa hispida]
MDGDLWDWPYDQGFSFSDADESSCNLESGWQADFYFDNGKDVIEENAMNEKYCIQVLKILIRKADADIDDLEENLVLLQCDLAWTESRNQFEACCTALRENIDFLDHSLKSWRQSDHINTNDQLPLHRQAAEKLYEILKPFLGDGREQDDGQDHHTAVNNRSTETEMQSIGLFCDTSSISGIKVKSEETGVKSILLAVDTISNGSVQKHKEDDSIRDIEVKPKIAIHGVRINSIMTEENSCSKPDNLKPVSKVKIEEAKEHLISNSCKSKRLKSASNVVGERGLLKAHKQGKSVAEKVNPGVPRQSDGFSGSKRSFDATLSSPAHSKSGNCNIEEKLIDFLLRTKRNKSDAGPVLPQSIGSASSCLSSNTKGMVDSDLQVLETRKPSTFDTSNVLIMLLAKLQDQQGSVMVRTQTKETDMLLLEDSQNVNVYCEKSHLNVDHKLKAFTEKRQSKLYTSISKAKKSRKPGAIGDGTCLDRPLEWNTCQVKAEMQDCAFNVEKNLGPLSQNKGASKMLVGQEFIDLSLVDISSSDQIKTDSRSGEDKQMVKSRATIDDQIAKILALLPSSAVEPKKLTLVDLRIIAKELNLTNYHKLRKTVLLDLLVGRLKNDLLVDRLKSC